MQSIIDKSSPQQTNQKWRFKREDGKCGLTKKDNVANIIKKCVRANSKFYMHTKMLLRKLISSSKNYLTILFK